jgi:hypothetical protein
VAPAGAVHTPLGNADQLLGQNCQNQASRSLLRQAMWDHTSFVQQKIHKSAASKQPNRHFQDLFSKDRAKSKYFTSLFEKGVIFYEPA